MIVKYIAVISIRADVDVWFRIIKTKLNKRTRSFPLFVIYLDLAKHTTVIFLNISLFPYFS